MKNHVSLTVASVIGALLFTVHVTHDFIFGLDSMTRPGTFVYLLIMLVWLYGALELRGRRTGFVIVLLTAVLAAGMPVLHYAGGPRSIARGFFFVWTLMALGATGVFAGAVAARELALSIRRRPA